MSETELTAGVAPIDRESLLRSLEWYDEVNATVDERTRQIVARRRQFIRRRGWLVRRVLLAADVISLTSAFLLAEWLTTKHLGGAFGTRIELLGFLLSLPLWVVAAKLQGLYSRDEEHAEHSTADELIGVFQLVSVGAWLLAAGSYVTRLAHPTLGKLLSFWIAAVVLVPTARAVGRAISRKRLTYLQNTIVLGAGEVGFMIAKKILDHPEYRLNLVGVVGNAPPGLAETDGMEQIPLLGETDRLPAIIHLLDVDRVIVAFSDRSDKRIAHLVKELAVLDVQIDVVPRLFELFAPNAGLHMMEGFPLVALPPTHPTWSSMFVKRLVDLLVALVGLVVAAPALALIALAVKVDSDGPVLYRHRRLGFGGRQIDVMKFRTMRREACRGERYGGEEAEREFARLMSDPINAATFATLHKLSDDPRVTLVGRLLRKLSLDELPQLVNVLLGQLSLVGPRPITAAELERYGGDARSLLSVRPGVTGYWQVNGRSRLAYEDRVRLDLSYIRGWSLGLDLRILGDTVRVLLSRRDAT